MKSFIQSYVSDLKNFYQAFLDLLSKIDTNPTTFKVMLLINNINPRFFQFAHPPENQQRTRQ
ncbi:hypothetical protein BTM151_00870 [Helicobacter pylori]